MNMPEGSTKEDIENMLNNTRRIVDKQLMLSKLTPHKR